VTHTLLIELADRCLIWSHCVPIATLLYAFNYTIYLEMAPVYPWEFRMPHLHEYKIYELWEQFIVHYTPYVFARVPYEKARKWKEQTYNILDSIMPEYWHNMFGNTR